MKYDEAVFDKTIETKGRNLFDRSLVSKCSLVEDVEYNLGMGYFWNSELPTTENYTKELSELPEDLRGNRVISCRAVIKAGIREAEADIFRLKQQWDRLEVVEL